MKIVTYNGQGKENWCAALTLDPDVLLFQEATPPPENIKSRTDWRPTRNKWGTAVYVKQGTISRLEIKHDYEWLPGWLVGMDIEGSLNPLGTNRKLRVFSLHTPPSTISGISYPNTVQQMLKVIAQNRGDADFVIGGDFNLLSLGERHELESKDAGKPWAATRQEKDIHKQLADLGLMNCWQVKNPGMSLGRTLRYRSKESSPAFHCDGLFVPETWKHVLASADILVTADWAARSDHNPVVVTFSQSTE